MMLANKSYILLSDGHIPNQISHVKSSATKSQMPTAKTQIFSRWISNCIKSHRNCTI